MKKYFDIYIEFNRDVIESTIMDILNKNQKAYVCVIDGTNLSYATLDDRFKNIINSAHLNISDGSSIALLQSIIHRKKLKSQIGGDLFLDYIKTQKFKSYFLGSQQEILNGLQENLLQYDPKIQDMTFQSLPYNAVEEFDYSSIAKLINRDSPDFIWISLGAPKQEEFMYRLLPHINRGVMMGIGAVFNFYSKASQEKRAPAIMLKLKIEWLYRLLQNPAKQWPRIKQILKVYPKLFINEFKFRKKQSAKS